MQFGQLLEDNLVIFGLYTIYSEFCNVNAGKFDYETITHFQSPEINL